MSPLFAFTAGSLGDILSTVELLIKVAKTLSNITSDEQRALLFEIQSLNGTLCSIRGILDRHHSPLSLESRRFDLAALTNLEISIYQEVALCRRGLAEFLASASISHSSSGSNSIGNVFSRIWWTATEKKAIEHLRTKLSSHRSNLTLQLLGLTLLSTNDIKNVIRSSSVTTGVNSWQHCQPPRYHIEPKQIRILDALGQTISIPRDLCTTWDFLHNIILSYSHGRRAESYISTGSYDLIDPQSDVALNPNTFNDLLQQQAETNEGWSFEMCIISTKKVHAVEMEVNCHKCGHVFETPSGWTTCSKCLALCSVLVMISPAARTTELLSQRSQDSAGKLEGDNVPDSEMKDLHLFRRVKTIHRLMEA